MSGFREGTQMSLSADWGDFEKTVFLISHRVTPRGGGGGGGGGKSQGQKG